MSPVVAIVIIAALVVVGGIVAYVELERGAPSRTAATFELSYATDPHWSDQLGVQLTTGSNVTVSWVASTSVPGMYIAFVQGGEVTFSENSDAGNGSFASAGGPLTISADGILNPAVTVNVSVSYAIPPAGGPIA